MSYNRKRCIVRNSKDNFYEFHLHNGNLIVENNNIGQTVLKKDILDYALDIDKNDMIHIVYLNSRGELNYLIYNNDIKDMNILIVNDKYLLKCLTLKAINSVIHIFYQVDSLKGDVSSIYHNYLINGSWRDEKLTETCCPRYVCSYFIDCYKSDIYVLYCWNYDLGEYNIKKLDTNKNVWEDFEKGVIIKDSSSLSFFIAPNDIGIICFSKFVDTNIQTFVKYKDFSNLSNKWSLDINVSNNTTNTLKPLVFYKDNYTYVTWKQENKIVYRKSSDILNWSKEFILDAKSENIYKMVYLNNNSEQSSLKINHIYIPNVEFLYFIVNSKSDYSYDRLSFDNINDDVLHEIDIDSNNNYIESLKTNYNQFIEKKNNYIKKLISEIERKDERITYLSEVNSSLTNKLNDIRNSINKYEDKLQHIKVEQALNNQKYFSITSHYENEIRKLKEEKEILLEDMNKKVKNLLKIIEGKEHIIQKLVQK